MLDPVVVLDMMAFLLPWSRLQLAAAASQFNRPPGCEASVSVAEAAARARLRDLLAPLGLAGVSIPSFLEPAAPTLTWLCGPVHLIAFASRKWNVRLEDGAPLEGFARRAGVAVQDLLLSLNRDRPYVAAALAQVSEFVTDMRLFRDVAAADPDRPLIIPEVAVPMLPPGAIFDTPTGASFFFVYLYYCDYDVVLTFCEMPLEEWIFVDPAVEDRWVSFIVHSKLGTFVVRFACLLRLRSVPGWCSGCGASC